MEAVPINWRSSKFMLAAIPTVWLWATHDHNKGYKVRRASKTSAAAASGSSNTRMEISPTRRGGQMGGNGLSLFGTCDLFPEWFPLCYTRTNHVRPRSFPLSGTPSLAFRASECTACCFNVLGRCHPPGSPGWRSQLRLQFWLSLSHCRNGLVAGKSMYLSLSLFIS